MKARGERKPVAIPADLHARLVAEADRRDVSVARLVTWAVERVLPAWEATDLDRLLRRRDDET